MLTVCVCYCRIMLIPHNCFSIGVPRNLLPMPNFSRTAPIKTIQSKLNRRKNKMQTITNSTLKFGTGKKKKEIEGPEGAKPDSNGDVLFGSLGICGKALGVEVLRLTCRRRWTQAVHWRLLKVLGRRRRGGRRRIRSSGARFLGFRSVSRRHCRRLYKC